MALYLIEIETLRTACRQKIESCELWLRRLVHDVLLAQYGNEYLAVVTDDNQNLFPKSARDNATARIKAHPARYRRQVDALELGEIAAFICKPTIYSRFFARAFNDGFPCGAEQVRFVLDRLAGVRNSLSHANPINLHDAERALCYSDDIISALVAHYKTIGMDQEFNVPTFTRVSDSLGNVVQHHTNPSVFDFRSKALRCGDTLRIETEVDAHFAPDEFSIDWHVLAATWSIHVGDTLVLELLPIHVSEHLKISVFLRSNKEWHRHGGSDDYVDLVYKVLPPL